MIIRAGICLVLLFVALVIPLSLFLMLIVVYAFKWNGYELIVLGVLLDGYFGFTISVWPIYTIGIVAAIVVVEFIKPRLSFYT